MSRTGGFFGHLRGWLGMLLVVLAGAAGQTVRSQGFPNTPIVNTNGPITRITVGVDGSLQLEHENYPYNGQFFPNMVAPADSGFFIRHNGVVVGMDYMRHTQTAASLLRAAPFYPISQESSPDGLRVTTVMDNRQDLSGVPLTVTQVVAHVPGESWLLVRNTVVNHGATNHPVDLFAAADIYLAGDDKSLCHLNTDCERVAVGGTTTDRSFFLFLQAAPDSPLPSGYQEDQYGMIWTTIGEGLHFLNTTNADYVDNGAGLEWQGVSIPAGGSYTVCYYWGLGTLQCVPPAAGVRPLLHPPILDDTNIVLRWECPGWLLLCATNPSEGPWNLVPIPLNTNSAVLPIGTSSGLYFRLQRP
ncbi:MAG TPA: hypothetical protein PKX23_12490 [Verrucomicrobiota bacterium]|nr:hypothetical protein [Verrucomicrobiota bacterium]HRT56634.1 hypothetical protein [Candidatus Paceibacterota bacterium]